MTLFKGVDFILETDDAPVQETGEVSGQTATATLGDEGELMLLGQQAATAGYIRDGQPHRSAGEHNSRHRTGDVFKVVAVTQGETRRVWIQHCCRQDDLLVHTSGEMTNPVPAELALSSAIAVLKGTTVQKMVLLGQKRPR
jgi:hypothetical protein